MMVQAGAVSYNSVPLNVFDNDFAIPTEAKAMRWFCRADSLNGKLTTHLPCGNTTHIKRKSISRTDYITKSYDEFEGTTGCYYSPNLFYNWRREVNLQGFTANWIDLDVADHAALDEDMSGLVTQEICKALWNSGLPMPTALVATGSGGLHLYWLYKNPVMSQSASHSKALLKHWRTLANTLVTTMDESREKLGYTGWTVDKSASNNPTGLMRIPGSIHNKTGRVVTYLKGGAKVDFNSFAQGLNLDVQAPALPSLTFQANDVAKPQSTFVRKTRTVGQLMARTANANGALYTGSSKSGAGFGTREKGQAQEFDTIGQRFALKDIMRQWEQCLVQSGVVQEGARDLTVFHLYNCARRLMDVKDAWQYITDINERFVRLTDGQLKSYLSTAQSRIYYYSLPRLKRIMTQEIGLPIVFPERPLKVKQGLSVIKRRQSSAGRQTAKQRAISSQVIVEAAMKRLCVSGQQLAQLSPASVVKKTKLSRATVYRHWKKARQALQANELPSLRELLVAAAKVSHMLVPPYSALCEKKESLDLLKDLRVFPDVNRNLDAASLLSQVSLLPKPPD